MKKVLLTLILFSTVFITPVSIVAQTENVIDIESKREELRQKALERDKERKNLVASKAARVKQKLTDLKLKVCERKQDTITRRSVNLANRARRHFDIFLGIARRVDNFYNQKLVPQGVVVDNYEALKAEIKASQDELEQAVNSAKTVAAGFDCSGEDPKGQLEDFRSEVQLVIEALKDYRESIKNFIVAIRTANSESKEATSSADN